MKKLWIMITTAAMCLALAACSANIPTETASVSGQSEAAAVQDAAVQADDGSEPEVSADDADELSEYSPDDMFTSRDLSGEYEIDTEVTLSDSGTLVSGSGVEVSGSTVTFVSEGTYLVSGTLTDGTLVVDADTSAKVQLVLDGANISSSDYAAVYVLNADKVFITTAKDSVNSVSVSGAFVQRDENNVDGAIFAKDDLTLNGSGTLNVYCAEGHGIVCKDDLKVTGGTVNIDAAAHGLSGKDSVRIASGTLDINAGTHGIKADNDEDAAKGYVYIAGGNIAIKSAEDGIHASSVIVYKDGECSIDAGDDGIHSDTDLLISGGVINISGSYEGLEGNTVSVTGGEITLKASDDGINAAGGNDSSGFETFGGGRGGDMFGSDASAVITISGGVLNINADGDGIDSNGTIDITGGEIRVSGPVNAGNGALDFGSGASISGGTAVLTGAVGMDENFTGGTQCSFVARLPQTAAGGTGLTVTDSSGNVILSFAPDKSYQSVVVSSPELKTGETYTVTAGSQSVQVEQTSTQTGSGSGMGGFGGGMQGGPGGRMPGGFGG